jgi:agmatinase
MNVSESNDRLSGFDPNGVGETGKLFGLPFDEESAEMVIIPVPWEVTVSYASGTAKGPEAVLEASSQVDLFQQDIVDAWKMGICLLPLPEELILENNKQRELASNYIHWLEKGGQSSERGRFGKIPKIINRTCENMNRWVYETARQHLSKGKSVGLLGGDHSTPLGLIRALSEAVDDFGVLQIDAHADLRPAYEDFQYSHASISYNFMQLPQISNLVQVGIRDFCEQEFELAKSDSRIILHTADHIHAALFKGHSWDSICEGVISGLPKKIYLTIDIDGLDPKLCPHTGTPVPGGLEYPQLDYLVKKLVQSGREIIGFDIVEVAPGPDGDEWDANVGARLLYRMANLVGVSQGKLQWNS